jgi:hypothetical protein
MSGATPSSLRKSENRDLPSNASRTINIAHRSPSTDMLRVIGQMSCDHASLRT